MRAAPEATAASKLYPSASEPAILPTVSVNTSVVVAAKLGMQPRLVADVQDEVLQAAPDSDALALCS